MPFYRKKATVQELIEYRPGELPLGVRTREDGSAYVWNELHKSEVNLDPGDFVNVSTPGDLYPIKAAVVAESYELVTAEEQEQAHG